MASALKDCNSEVTDVTLESPALLGMILHAELSFKASNAEVDFVLSILHWNLARKQQILVGIRIFHDSHDCHEFFESANIELEELKFFFENFEHVVYNLDEVDFATSDHLTAALNIRSYSWENKLGINLTITFYKSVAELSWDEHPTWLEDLHVVSQDDIVNVSCNRSICANTVLFHLRYEISFAQVAGSLGSTLNNPT